jgi:hypothetical protein
MNAYKILVGKPLRKKSYKIQKMKREDNISKQVVLISPEDVPDEAGSGSCQMAGFCIISIKLPDSSNRRT